MVVFALSCFALLLFLWLAFGGPVPLKPKGYQFVVAVPEANQLAVEADVRSSGVTIGKIKKKAQAPKGNRTLVTVQVDPKYAPIDKDARVIQRTKTLLGEKFLEITRGTPGGPQVAEGGRLPDASVEETTELDEVLNILDKPTQQLFREWQRELGRGVEKRGGDLNDAFGTLPRFTASGTDVLETLDRQEAALRGLVRNTGVVFGALTEKEGQLRDLIVNTDDVFEATARQRENLAATFRIFPTFLDESRATARNLESFSRQTRPLVRDLRPALQDLRPTVRDVRALAPDLRSFFRNLDPVITASRTGLPALRQTLDATGPMLGTLQPFLEELNPLLEWLEYSQHHVADFLSNGGGALVDTAGGQRYEFERGHYLGEFSMRGPDSIVGQPRPPSERGNAYPDLDDLIGPRHAKEMANGSWDCRHAGGEQTTEKGDTRDAPSCWVGDLPGPSRFPHIERADYSRPSP
jgi:virulence factor Mce-like protein